MIAPAVVIALVAAVANAFAIVLQATEARRSPIGEGARPALLVRLARRPRWLVGTALMVLAWPLQILALALAPITVVQPTLASTTLVLLGLAKLRLRERLGPSEILAGVAIVVGVAAVVWAAPRHLSHHAASVRIAVPLVVVGAGALLAFAVGRARPRIDLSLVVGAGLAYAWVDFANKLLARALAGAQWVPAALWLTATLGFGAVAFLEEMTALQRRPAITVAPVIGAVQDPLPVVMALWAGIEVWSGGSHRVVPLLCGLTAVTVGAVGLGRSRAVATLSAAGQADRTATAGRSGSGGTERPLMT